MAIASFWSLAELIPWAWRRLSLSSAGLWRWNLQQNSTLVIIIVHSIRSGGHPCHQVLFLAVVINQTQIFLNCHAWAIDGSRLLPLCLELGSQVWPTVMTTPIKGLLALWLSQQGESSQLGDGGHPCCQFSPPDGSFLKANLLTISHIRQFTFILPLEVVGPGGNLSMLLLLCHHSVIPVVECPGRRQR